MFKVWMKLENRLLELLMFYMGNNREYIVGGEKCEYGEFKFTHNCIDCVMSFNW